MKQCISRIILHIIHLWQTLKEYVCKIHHHICYHCGYDEKELDSKNLDQEEKKDV